MRAAVGSTPIHSRLRFSAETRRAAQLASTPVLPASLLASSGAEPIPMHRVRERTIKPAITQILVENHDRLANAHDK